MTSEYDAAIHGLSEKIANLDDDMVATRDILQFTHAALVLGEPVELTSFVARVVEAVESLEGRILKLENR